MRVIMGIFFVVAGIVISVSVFTSLAEMALWKAILSVVLVLGYWVMVPVLISDIKDL